MQKRETVAISYDSSYNESSKNESEQQEYRQDGRPKRKAKPK